MSPLLLSPAYRPPKPPTRVPAVYLPSVVTAVGVSGGDLEQNGANRCVLCFGVVIGSGDDGVVVVDVAEKDGDSGGGGVLSGRCALVRGHHLQHVTAVRVATIMMMMMMQMTVVMLGRMTTKTMVVSLDDDDNDDDDTRMNDDLSTHDDDNASAYA